MPSNLVKTKADEKLWAEAKRECRKTYSEETSEFWGCVVTVYLNKKNK